MQSPSGSLNGFRKAWDTSKINTWKDFDNAAVKIHSLWENASKEEQCFLTRCLKGLDKHAETIKESRPEEEKEDPDYFTDPWGDG
jgi:hypothetical protein